LSKIRSERVHVFGRGDSGYSGWSKAKGELDKKAKVKGWTLHDMRAALPPPAWPT
jgi:hypothetical protein